MADIRHNVDLETDASMVCQGGGSANAAISSPPHNGSAKQQYRHCCKPRCEMFDVMGVSRSFWISHQVTLVEMRTADHLAARESCQQAQ